MFKKSEEKKQGFYDKLNPEIRPLYGRKDLMKQARKDRKNGLLYSAGVYALFMIIAMVADYVTIQSFMDLALRTNVWMGRIMVGTLVFLIDVVVPLGFTKVMQNHLKQSLLKKVLFVSILAVPIILLLSQFLQKIAGMELTYSSLATLNFATKLFTTVLFGVLPLCTTISVTALGLIRDNMKIYRKFRYTEIAKDVIAAKRLAMQQDVEYEKKMLQLKDDEQFINTINDICSMSKSLHEKSRQLLAEHLGNPEAADVVFRSEAELPEIAYAMEVKTNPANHVRFEGQDTESNNETSDGGNF